MNKQAAEPFEFNSQLSLTELTGLKARNLQQMLTLLKEVPGASIFHHTHRFLRQHMYLSPEPPNDFAYWAENSLGDRPLAEALASIDIIHCDSVRAIRERFIAIISEHLRSSPQAAQRFTSDDSAFHFMKAVSFIFHTGHKASNLKEFADVLRTITIDSIYFHIFTARLRLEKGNNDFSRWFAESLGETQLAAQIANIDPYTCTAESLRGILLRLIEKRVNSHE